jgi:hypothetical protein
MSGTAESVHFDKKKNQNRILALSTSSISCDKNLFIFTRSNKSNGYRT